MWERLCAVNGDTEFVDAAFLGHAGRSTMRDALEAARLTQAAFKDVIPPPGEHRRSGMPLCPKLSTCCTASAQACWL